MYSLSDMFDDAKSSIEKFATKTADTLDASRQYINESFMVKFRNMNKQQEENTNLISILVDTKEKHSLALFNIESRLDMLEQIKLPEAKRPVNRDIESVEVIVDNQFDFEDVEYKFDSSVDGKSKCTSQENYQPGQQCVYDVPSIVYNLGEYTFVEPKSSERQMYDFAVCELSKSEYIMRNLDETLPQTCAVYFTNTGRVIKCELQKNLINDEKVSSVINVSARITELTLVNSNTPMHNAWLNFIAEDFEWYRLADNADDEYRKANTESLELWEIIIEHLKEVFLINKK
jgi:hypothetical protein